MSPRVLKTHICSQKSYSDRPTPRSTKFRKIQRDKAKSKSSYKKYLHQEASVPRTTTYRRKLLNQLCVDGSPQLNVESEVDSAMQTTETHNKDNEDIYGEHFEDNVIEDGNVWSDEAGNDNPKQGQLQKQKDTLGEDMEVGSHSSHEIIEEQNKNEVKENPPPLPQKQSEPVYPGSSLTKEQSLLLLMSYILRHNLTGVALQDLLHLMNEHLPGLVPKSSFLFHKAYGEFGEYVPHIYCTDCEMYLGPRENTPKFCLSCKAEIDFEKNLQAGSSFLVMSLSKQIVQVLEKSKLQEMEEISEIISDIQCGAEYRKLKSCGQIGSDDVSLLWNCDGIPVFKSNNIQIWPIQCQIIELSPTERQENICIPCLWFGNSKPNMITYMSGFVSQLKELEQFGLKWKDKENRQHISRVHALVCSSDSIARPLLRNTKQFNGKYGCDFCLHPGGGPYVWKRPEPALRTAESHFQHAMEASADEPIMGVKGPSPLMELSSMNMITSFIPEYQHSVCLGVTKQITSLWLDSRNHNEEWYIGNKIGQIDQELLGILPPLEITRVPRSINERKFWKASEWRSFLLFYALPVLNGILKKKYVNHLFLLIFAMHTLLQDAISIKHIDVAERALRKFVFEFEKLYGSVNVSFNVHLLIHLAASVRNWGPLWATSTFPFESFNGTLLTFFNGTTHIPAQIVKRFLRWRGLSVKAKTVMTNANDDVKNLFHRLQGTSHCVKTSKEFKTGVRGFGCPKSKSMSVLQRKALEHFTGLSIYSGLFYDRFTCRGDLYHSYNSTTLKKRNNSVAQLSDGRYCEILTLLNYSAENCVNAGFCVLVKELKNAKNEENVWKDVQLKISSVFITEVSKTSNVFAVDPLSLRRKCVLFGSLNKLFVIPLPNNIERD